MSESQSGQLSAAHASTRVDDDAPFALSQEPVTAEGPAPVLPAGTVPAPAYEHLGELPASYGTQSVYLVAYDPRQLFVYWDIDWKSSPSVGYSLHVCRADGALEKRVDIASTDAGRYVDVAQPVGTYFVELGRYGRDGGWKPLAHSGRVTMPPPGLSGDLEPKFATLPFHLSFHRLLELIDNAMGHGEDLTAALSRLQHGGHPEVNPLLKTLHRLSGDQLHTLEMLLGQRFEIASDTSSPAGGPPGAAAGLPEQREALSSGAFGSENLSSGAFGSENLSSGAFGSESLSSVGMLSSETLSSGGVPNVGSETLSSGALTMGSETLSSGGFGSESLASGALGSEWLSSGAFGSESLSSFTAGPSSEAWRMAASAGVGGGSDTMDSERATMFLHAVEKNLDVLSSLFSGFGSPGGSDGFSAGGW